MSSHECREGLQDVFMESAETKGGFLFTSCFSFCFKKLFSEKHGQLIKFKLFKTVLSVVLDFM